LDLNLESYSRENLYQLFGLQVGMPLTEAIMKEAKRNVQRTHPDKSQLHEKYFIFFSNAYKRLVYIYEYQQKTSKAIASSKVAATDYHATMDDDSSQEDAALLQRVAREKTGSNFQSWFNQEFERVEGNSVSAAPGHGDWLKSEEDICYFQPTNTSQMNGHIEKKKRELQTLIPYQGYTESYASSSLGSSLMEGGAGGGAGGGGGFGTDLRQAYVESVIPVSEEDFAKRKQYRNVDEYKSHRESMSITPLSKEEGMKQLISNQEQHEEESAALAFYYAKQQEKAMQTQQQFMKNLKQLT
jgi:hypothetical protein